MSGSSTDLTDDPNAQALAAALGGQYQLARLLGRGGMGAVYLAHEPFLDRHVAVKVLPAELASGEARERFLREARTAARLSHPNIVPLHTFGQAGALLYYVMGFIEGESLEAQLRRTGRLGFDEARKITAELAGALEYAHSMGVVHRDIKPDNILLDQTGRALLTDFGIAKHRATHDTLTQTGVIVGTPHYMSPEQASGEREIDGRSDIYSLGVIAYRMVTGRLPFEGSGMREVLAQHATRAPTPAAMLAAGLPVDLDTAIAKALEKDPATRWRSARALRDALSGDSEEAIPDQLRDISGMGVRLVLISAAFVEFGIIGRMFNFVDIPMAFVLAGLAALVQLIGPVASIAPARRFGWRATWQAYFRQPTWWSSWYPRWLRRPGDAWDRLPAIIRRLRAGTIAANGIGAVFVHLMVWGMRNEYATGERLAQNWWYWPTLSVYLIGTFGALLGYGLAFKRWTKRHGVDKRDAARLISESTGIAAFWNRPHIAELLDRDVASEGRVSPPRIIATELERAARDGKASPHADLYREAARAAAALVAALARLDDEIAAIARDNDPRESARITDMLGRTADSKLRELLERQLQVYRDLERQHRDIQTRRDRLVEQLRTLGLDVARLRAESAMDAATALDITGRIHAVCRDIDHRVEGLRDVRNLGNT